MDLTKTVGHCKKFDPGIWQGPFIIVRKFSDLVFEIQGKSGSKSKLVHHERLKSYHADVLPDWLHLKTGSFPKKTNECKKPRNRLQRKPRVFLIKRELPKQLFPARKILNR